MLATLSQCFRCGSTEIENRIVDEFLRRGSYVVVLRVPTNACASCGEQYFERTQVAGFEDVRHRLERGDLEGFRVTGEVLEPVSSLLDPLRPALG